jgi:hypothetical protein
MQFANANQSRKGPRAVPNPNRLFNAFTKLQAIPDISSTIDSFCAMVDELSLCSNKQEQMIILLKHSTTQYVP